MELGDGFVWLAALSVQTVLAGAVGIGLVEDVSNTGFFLVPETVVDCVVTTVCSVVVAGLVTRPATCTLQL